jgi:probable F420-dependent oxidoreductase
MPRQASWHLRALRAWKDGHVRAFRFGYQTRGGAVGEIRAQAQSAEAAGFDVFHSADHVGPGWSPLYPLIAAAEVTTTLRMCPLVLNNDFHHPVHLAMQLANLDHLSDGRLEVGVGAGHSFTEYEAVGLPFHPPAVRKARMFEAVELLRLLLSGSTVTFEGEHYRLAEVRTMRSRQDRMPMMVAVNGAKWWPQAVSHADIVGLTMLGRTLPDGHRHEVRWQVDHIDRLVGALHEQASLQGREPELNALVQVVEITDDRRGWAEQFVADVPTLSVDDALACPFLAVGTHDEIADHLRQCRRRWGISYFSVRSIEQFAPVIGRLREDPD